MDTRPIATRTYRHPVSGITVELAAGLAPGPGGQRWWRVALLRADGLAGRVEGHDPILHVRSRADARRAWRERQRALLAGGYVRVDSGG